MQHKDCPKRLSECLADLQCQTSTLQRLVNAVDAYHNIQAIPVDIRHQMSLLSKQLLDIDAEVLMTSAALDVSDCARASSIMESLINKLK